MKRFLAAAALVLPLSANASSDICADLSKLAGFVTEVRHKGFSPFEIREGLLKFGDGTPEPVDALVALAFTEDRQYTEKGIKESVNRIEGFVFVECIKMRIEE